MAIASFIKEDLIHIDLEVENQEQLFEKLYETAFAKGYVKESFLAKIKEREAIFPTGLKVNDYNVAIPHTDPEHIIEQFIFVATLKNPVTFSLMEDSAQKEGMQIILMLGLNQPHSQIEVLQELMQIIQIDSNLEALTQATDKQQIVQLFEQINTSLKGGA